MDVQLKTLVQARNRGSGRPLPPIGDRLKSQTHGKVPGISAKALFFSFINIDLPLLRKFVVLCQHLEHGPKCHDKHAKSGLLGPPLLLCIVSYVDTVRKDAKKIEEYIKNQLQEDLTYDPMSLKNILNRLRMGW